MKKKCDILFFNFFLVFLAIIIFLLLLFVRYSNIVYGLPSFSPIEPLVVGHATGNMHGDLNPYFYIQGPLYSYLLSLIYFVVIFFSNLSYESFLQDVFFNYFDHYFIARASTTIFSILAAFFAYLLSLKFFNYKTAIIVLIIAVFPFIEFLNGFTVKIDVLLAVWSLLAVYYTLKFNQTKKIKYYLIVGLLIGLSLATKFLPGLLIIPTVLLGHFLSIEGKNLILKIKNFFNIKLLILFLYTIYSHFLFNPYSLVDFKFFILSQYNTFKEEAFYDWGEKGWRYIITFTDEMYLGYFFVLLSIAGAFYFIYKFVKTGKSLYLIIFSYPFVFFLAFAPFSAHLTFYSPIIPFLVIMMAKLIIDISEKIKFLILKYFFILIMICLILYQPIFFMYKQYLSYSKESSGIHLNSQLSGKNWIEKNIPNMSKILLYGIYADMPRIVDYRVQNQIENIEDCFYEGVGKKRGYIESYKKAYEEHIKNGRSVFELELERTCPGCRRLSEEDLFKYCMENNFDYFIASEDLNMDKYQEFQERKFKVFKGEEYQLGKGFVIYKLK